MPGNSQPMQCLPSFKVLMSCAADLETLVQWAVIKNDKGLCAIGQRAEGCRWWFSDAWSGCPVAHNPAFRCSVYQGSIAW